LDLGRATPSLRPNPYAARSPSTPAERHLSKRGNCSDERSQLYVHPNQITQWKGLLLEGAAGVFGRGGIEAGPAPVDLKTLHAKIGELALENDFLEGALTKAGLLSAKR
jgi:hypothetical protein